MPNTNPSLTIAILSRQWLVWLGLQKILDGRATVQMVVPPYQWRIPDGSPTDTRPDVVILDLETAPDAVGTINQIRESAPTCKIVLLCGLEDRDHMREAYDAGVDGVILKIQPPTVMLAVIESLYAPTKPQDYWERTGAVLGSPVKKKDDADALTLAWPNALTEREREIIRLVAQGLSNKDIAYKLSISDSTVRHHMTNIFEKVGVPNRQNLLIHTYQFHSRL
ncbi:response regulator transcription factor [Candidatus Nitrospira nitrificans]|uniref:Putative Response regulator, LuxR family n=1 Tax=Candidatus Nitrospira nitrificans TaxID=1742973 RepID=A0A0S4L7L5_9BACT|nr:response regulator transcription factor [Candidatus Nitrospira nitrificans]CUS31812.1 putative Response regulator, LuxR family [Candidatus Nitrospira nitrificans]